MEFSDDFYEFRRQMHRWDHQNILDYAKEEGRKAGLEEARAARLEVGALAIEREIAKKIKNRGIDLKIIADATGLSIEDIIAL